jgi:hypothetical protein
MGADAMSTPNPLPPLPPGFKLDTPAAGPSGATPKPATGGASPSGDDWWKQSEEETAQEPSGLPKAPTQPPDKRWSAEGPMTDWRSWAAAGIRLGTKVAQNLEQGEINDMSRASFGLTDKLRAFGEKEFPTSNYMEPQFMQHIRDEYTRAPETMAGKIDEGLATFLGPMLIPGGGGPEEDVAQGVGKVSRVAEGADEKLYGLIRQLGGKVAPQEQPTATLAARAGRLVQKMAGSIDTFRGISHDNVEWADNLIRTHFKLPEGSDLTPELFDSIIDGAGNVYEDARNIGQFSYDEGAKAAVANFGNDFLELAARHPEAWDKATIARVHELRSLLMKSDWTGNDAVEVVKTLRANAREALRQGTLKPQSWLLGSLERNAANALEEILGKAGEASGIPNLSTRLGEARKTIAQAYDASGALLNGHISSHLLARMQRAALSRSGRTAGLAPLSGNLRLLADAAGRFPRSFQDAAKAAKMETTNVGKVLATVGAYGFFMHNKALMALAAGEVGARAIVTSKLLQTSVSDPQVVPMVMGAAGRFLAERPVGTALTAQQVMSQNDRQSIIDLALIFGPLGSALGAAAPLAMKERAREAGEMYEAGELNDGRDGNAP